MQALVAAVAKQFPAPAPGTRYRNELQKLSAATFKWRTSESARPCSSENFQVLGKPCRLEVLPNKELRIWRPGNAGWRPKVKVNGSPLPLASEGVAEVPDGDVEVELEVEDSGEGGSHPAESHPAPEGAERAPDGMLQSVEVLGEHAATWRIKLQRNTKEISDFFAESSQSTGSAEEPARSGSSSTSSRAAPTSSGGLCSKLFGSGASSSTISSPPTSTGLVSTPFRLYNVLLGDFWLEIHPQPEKNTAAVFFRCGYPELVCRANLAVSGTFQKQVISTGRSSLEQELARDAYLPVNFNVAEAWKGEGEIEIAVQLVEIVQLPRKLQGVL